MNFLTVFSTLEPVLVPFLFILGLLIGSFLNVVVYRYPEIFKQNNLRDINEYLKELKIGCPNLENSIKNNEQHISLSFPNSHCPKCNHQIKWYENIPVLSYLFLGGKCSNCKNPIGLVYPSIELITAFIFILPALFFTNITLLLPVVLFMAIGWTIFLLDLKTMFIPDILSYILLWGSILLAYLNLNILQTTLNEAVLAAMVGYLILWLFGTIGKIIKKSDAMGQGDYKLIAGIGAFIGLKGVIFTIFFAPFIGIAFWIILSIIKKINQKDVESAIAYGPSLVLASWIFILYKQEIAQQFAERLMWL